tara:strand:+ start:121 stop:738 length:618 start_codon:yes stop_codon:yes gene_type:complete
MYKTNPKFHNSTSYYGHKNNWRHIPHSIYSAGVLPYFIDENGTIYTLLGKDLDGVWSDFGGRCEPKDKSDPETTAAREFYEESIGSIMDINIVSSRIKYDKEFTKCLHSKTLNGSPYYMYLVKIPYNQNRYREEFKRAYEFQKYIQSDKKYLEKTDIRWVSFDTLMSSMENKNNEQVLVPLRKVFKATINTNKTEISNFLNSLRP